MADKGRHIDVNASSLVDLKAELLRKQAEFRQQKLQNTTNHSLAVPKKPNIWSKKNAGVLERAQTDLERKTEDADVMDQARLALEAKARLYEQMSCSNTISDEDGSKHFLVDFEQKTLTAQAERRRMQQESADMGRADQQKQESEDKELISEKHDEMPSNPDDQWVDYVDSFGRSRRCLRKDLADMISSSQKSLDATKDPDLLSADMKRELQRQQWEREAEDALSRPVGPVHYANVRYDEIRDHGVGFFEFSKDEERRQQQLEALKKLRQQTDEQRARSEAVKEKRKTLLEARLAKVRQRKTVHVVPDLDLDVNTSEGGGSETGPKMSEAIEPEPLVRDESLRQTDSIREWDRGKKTIYDKESWLKARRDERLSEFAPPQFYATNSAMLPSQERHKSPVHASQRPQKRSLYGSGPQQQDNTGSRTDIDVCSSTDSVTTMLQSIRSSVEQSDSSHNETVVTYPTRSSDEVQSQSVDFTMPPSCYLADGSMACVDRVSYSVNFDNQMMTSSRTDSSLLLDQVSSMVNVPPETLPTSSSAIFDLSSSTAASVAFSEAGITAVSFDVCSSNLAPQPAHYSSAPSGPQPKLPKYERVFLHDLPPTLPLPPLVGSSNTQYPSQEEVIGPKRRKDPNEVNEKDAIRNWYRQFEQKRTKPVVPASADDTSQLLKPRNIPFASPYIQSNDASSKVMDDPAAKEFDPSKPPPSAESNDRIM